MQSASMKKKQLAHAVGAAGIALGAQQALGAGFALQEQNASGLGNAYAGGAAVAEDASTVWSNPAGMARFSTIQIVASVAGIFPSSKFSNDGSLPAFASRSAATGGDAGAGGWRCRRCTWSCRSTADWAFGLGIGVPFGLETQLGRRLARPLPGAAVARSRRSTSTRRCRGASTTSSASASASTTSRSRRRSRATPTIPRALATRRADRGRRAGSFPPAAVRPFIGGDPRPRFVRHVTGDDWCVGLEHRPHVEHLAGHAHRRALSLVDQVRHQRQREFRQPVAADACRRRSRRSAPRLRRRSTTCSPSGGVTVDIELPAITNVSFYSRLNPKWEVMADVQFTDWSTIENLTFVRTHGPCVAGRRRKTSRTHGACRWRELLPGRQVEVSRRHRVGPVARARCRSDAAPAGLGPLLARGAACSTRGDKQLKFDVGVDLHLGVERPSNNNAGNTAQYGLIKGDYDTTSSSSAARCRTRSDVAARGGPRCCGPPRRISAVAAPRRASRSSCSHAELHSSRFARPPSSAPA